MTTTPPAGFPRLLTEHEVAAIFGVTGRTIRSWDASGVLRPVRVGGTKRYRADDIEGLLNGPVEGE